MIWGVLTWKEGRIDEQTLSTLLEKLPVHLVKAFTDHTAGTVPTLAQVEILPRRAGPTELKDCDLSLNLMVVATTAHLYNLNRDAQGVGDWVSNHLERGRRACVRLMVVPMACVEVGVEAR